MENLKALWKTISHLSYWRAYPILMDRLSKEKKNEAIEKLFASATQCVMAISLFDKERLRKVAKSLSEAEETLKECLNNYLDAVDALEDEKKVIKIALNSELHMTCTLGIALKLTDLCQDPLMYQQIFKQIMTLEEESYLYELLSNVYTAGNLLLKSQEVGSTIKENIDLISVAFEAVEQEKAQLSLSRSPGMRG